MTLQLPPIDLIEQATEIAEIEVPRELRSADPSERLEFSRPPSENVLRFDPRDLEDLEAEMFSGKLSALERERAAWEYAYRPEASPLPLLHRMAAEDDEPAVRWGLLWLIQKVAGSKLQAAEILSGFLEDEHPEVRDWARLLLRELRGVGPFQHDGRPAKFDLSNPFDQTLPLQIAGFARVQVPGMGWVQATLSPLWFESIMGRVMACTRAESFERDLVIEKRIKNYHPDGSDHHEIYMFRGFSQEIAPGVCYHHYEGQANHTFYPSGKAEDLSEDPLDDVVVNVQRVAMTVRVPCPGERSLSVVQSVRGRYMGSAYVNLRRLASNGMRLGPGEVQLSNLHHAGARGLTNTLLFGTFRGKLSDLDGDGAVDVNTERCHGTIDGRHDGDLDGRPDQDPFDPRAKALGTR